MSDVKPRLRVRLPIRLTVVSIFMLATVLTAVLAVGLQYYFSRNTAIQVALNRFQDLADVTGKYLNTVDRKAVDTTRILASYPSLTEGSWVNPAVRDLFAVLMGDSPMLYAIYIGFENGDFYELVNLNCSAVAREHFQAAPGDRWVLISIRGEGQARQRQLAFFDAGFNQRETRSESSDYNAAGRPWFIQAEAGVVKKTAPYLFHNLQAPGQTYSTRIKGGVVAVDIALSSISEYLANRTAEEFGNLFIYRESGELIATNYRSREDHIIPPSAPLVLTDAERRVVAEQGVLQVANENDWAPIDFAISGQPRGYSIDYLSLIAQMTGLRFEYINGYTWPELVDLYKAGDIDILQPIFDNGEKLYPGRFSPAFLELPYALVTRAGKTHITHLKQMRGKTIAVPEGWSILEVLRRQFSEINIVTVASTRAVFEAVSEGRVDAGLDVGEILHYTGDKYFYEGLQYHDNIHFGPVRFPTQLHLLVADEHRAVLPLIERAMAQVSEAQKTALARKWFYGPEQYREMLAVPYEQLITRSSQPQQYGQLIETRLAGRSSYMFVTPIGKTPSSSDYLGIVVPVRQVLKASLEKVRFSVLLTIAFLLLLAPAPWIFASPIVAPIKKLSEENEKIRRRLYDQLAIPDSYIKEIDELGKSMAAMVAAIRQHEANQIALMDSFIKLIAQAIDDKSHYTAGHCARVPELAFLLVEKAAASQLEPFKTFAFHSQEEWREFKVAAWLHDCGKITTPEHIVDKGSKLETIYNRIHEVRTRFEVLWRDAEIAYWQQLAKAPAEASRLRAELDAARQQLRDDFAFVAQMNIGGEYLSDTHMQRLRTLAKKTWTRHFDDRLGLSPQEENRLQGESRPLPCKEFLLADKPEHIIARDQPVHYPEHLGIKMDVPEHLYNQGELHNLCIERGTLTAEDRFKINEHIISTIRMLDALPFPAELSRVARYASTHHETMVGTGYPRQLTAEDLSIPERIMVLADIFEALTAADRPYKKAKPVSVAINILAKMVEEKHVDADVFELFLTSGVYLEYAQRYLSPEQVDEVDVQQYMRA